MTLAFAHPSSWPSVLHPDEVAADKTLALFGRAAARDLVDVEALSHHYSLERLCALAKEKDAGFDGDVLADALRVAASRQEAAFTELGLSPRRIEDWREWSADQRQRLLTDTSGQSRRQGRTLDDPGRSFPTDSKPGLNHPTSRPPRPDHGRPSQEL